MLITVVRGAPFTKTHPDKEEILVCNVVRSVEDSHSHRKVGIAKNVAA